jgi:hypothetical protein
MNVHSYGGYFMWPPGAYKADGRITLPRPAIDESKQFLDAARQIVGAIAAERGTMTWPAQTQQWDGVGFQPTFAEAHGEAMQYASGLVQLVRIAAGDAAQS